MRTCRLYQSIGVVFWGFLVPTLLLWVAEQATRLRFLQRKAVEQVCGGNSWLDGGGGGSEQCALHCSFEASVLLVVECGGVCRWDFVGGVRGQPSYCAQCAELTCCARVFALLDRGL
jgi:hypothetical protein